MDTQHNLEIEQIERDMERLVAEAEEAAASVRSALDGAMTARGEILDRANQDAGAIKAQAETDGNQIREKAGQDGEEIREQARADGQQIRSEAHEDAIAIVRETRDRAAQMLQTAQEQADRILDEARHFQVSIRESLPLVQEFLDRIGPALAEVARTSEDAHLKVADAIDALEPASSLGTDQGETPPAAGNTY